jgi:E3 ubiquitin-protein ligase NEDD4
MVPNGAKSQVAFEQLGLFRSLSMKHYVRRLKQPLKLLKQGISKIIPSDLLSLLTADELKLLICGPVKVEIDVLKKNTVYVNDTLKETDELVVNFWKVVESFSEELKTKFVKFCWG